MLRVGQDTVGLEAVDDRLATAQHGAVSCEVDFLFHQGADVMDGERPNYNALLAGAVTRFGFSDQHGEFIANL